MPAPELDIAGIVIPALLGVDVFIIIIFTVFIIIMARRKYDKRNKELNKNKDKSKSKNLKKLNKQD